MRKFKFYLDRNVTIWMRDHFSIIADTEEEAIEEVIRVAKNELYKGQLPFEGETETLYDTEEFIEAKENQASTVEIFKEDGETIWENLESYQNTTKLEKIYNNKAQHIKRFATVGFNRTQVIEIAKEYAEFCCEEQKKICADNGKIRLFTPFSDETNGSLVKVYRVHDNLSLEVDDLSILNAPTYKEEDGK